MNAWKPILAALVIFAAGVLTGGFTVKLRQPHTPRFAPAQTRRLLTPREAQLRDLLRRMQKELDLTPEQRQRIETVIRASQERMRTLRDEIGQKGGEEFREMRQKIRSELTLEQRRKFVEIMRQQDERKRDQRDPPPTQPPGERTE